ncbi:lycopene cyclase domain-containing protein [Microbacterium marinum]|uniref:Lycopene cyclase domain-containing protein n=1 Tax=Microbacterium marinum TaxID=421115 RepID=A0A7W7BQE3_9MICO|nr:lycopene cyclase domain-containing protein [Microbacterium marinum]
MPGLYLLFLVLSAAGIAALDLRFRLVMPVRPGRAWAAIALGTAFFVLWDLVGIATGVFVRGESPLLLGIDLAPHLPVEEPVFLAFLCYLALVLHAAAGRVRRPRREDAA